MQQGNQKPRMPQGFPGAFIHQQSVSSGMFSPPGYTGPPSSMPSQSSTEVLPTDQKQASETNIARHCRIGQELVHEIVHKSNEVFHTLKAIQLFNHLPKNSVAYTDRKKHLHDNLKVILDYFKQLKHIYVVVKDSCDKLNMKPAAELIPFVDEADSQMEESSHQSEAYKQVAAEHLALTQQLQAKNLHLKEIIDHLRNILWEVNTMMSVRENAA